MAIHEKLTKSERIRRLYDSGHSVAEIAKMLGIRYQFAYNVISYHVRQVEVKAYVAATGDDRTGDLRSNLG